MFKKLKSLLILIISFTLIFSQSISSSASGNAETLEAYEDLLEQLNTELGTNYKLSPSTGFTYDEMVAYYNNMTLDEFEQYIRDAYYTEQEFDETMELPKEMILENNIASRSTLTTQKYFYASNANYLYIQAYTTTVSGSTVYTGTMYTAGSSISTYPGYKMNSYSRSFASNKKSVDVTYKCSKYISANLISGTSHTINITFYAGGGNIRPIL